jgi:hypothetical protein
MNAGRALPATLLLYAAASLIHFAHNAEYLADYPNLPPSWTRMEVYLAWCVLAAIGVLGYVLYRRGSKRPGLVLIAIYAVFGFGGLLHYTRAPLGHHTAAMNVTIWGEALAAVLLLVNVVWVAVGRWCAAHERRRCQERLVPRM